LVVLAIVGLLLLGIGFGGRLHYTIVRETARIRDIDGQERELRFVLSDGKPVEALEVHLLGADEEVHVKYDCSRGNLIVGLIGKDEWASLVAEGKQNDPRRLKSESNDTKEIPRKVEVVTERTTIPNKEPKVIESTRTVEMPVRGETVLQPRGRAHVRIYVEMLFVFREAPGEVACRIVYSIWSYPNRNKFGLEISVCEIVIALGSLMVTIDGLYALCCWLRRSKN